MLQFRTILGRYNPKKYFAQKSADVRNYENLCPHCGHDVQHRHSNLRTLSDEILEIGLHFDHRHLRSLPLLLIPGALPQKFSGPERFRYSPPLKIYIFMALIFFGLTFAGNHQPHQTFETKGTQEQILADALKVQMETQHRGTAIDKKSPGYRVHVEISPLDGKLSLAELFTQEVYEKFKPDGVETSAWVHAIKKSLFIAMLVLFPPISLLLFLLYRKQKIAFWDHLAFVLYCQTSIFLLLIIQMVMRMMEWQTFLLSQGQALSLAAIFIFMSQKKYYQHSFMKTLSKFMVLGAVYFLTLLTIVLTSIILTWKWNQIN